MQESYCRNSAGAQNQINWRLAVKYNALFLRLKGQTGAISVDKFDLDNDEYFLKSCFNF